MNIYIPDIKLPKDEPGAFQVIVLYVGDDRKLRAECEGTHEVTIVQPHGRLIDADAMIEECHGHNSQRTMWGEIEYLIDNTPTIIPAEEGEI